MIRRLGLISIMLVAVSMFAVACGGDEEEDAGTSTPAPSTPTATEAAASPAATETVATPEVSGEITVYSGRSESLIAPILEQFTEVTGVTVNARYGSTSEMAAALLEEGSNSPADVFIAQDPGGLGAVEGAGLFAPLPDSIRERVSEQWRSSQGGWVGLSGRARVLVYNAESVAEGDLPASVDDLTDPRWSGQVGWAPANGSFQAFLAAMRVERGDDATREWLEAMLANDVQAYENNRAILEAVAAGEVRAGLTNHYYLHPFLAERGESFGARNHHFPGGDIGSMVSVAGGGVLNTAKNPAAAQALLEFLLSDEGQQYFTGQTFEYPVVAGIEANGDVVPLAEIEAPDVDLNDLTDLEGTLALLREVGALE